MPGDRLLREPLRRRAACLSVFLLANRVDRLLGITGNVVSSRLLGVLLASLAVQYVIDGVRVLLPA